MYKCESAMFRGVLLSCKSVIEKDWHKKVSSFNNVTASETVFCMDRNLHLHLNGVVNKA